MKSLIGFNLICFAISSLLISIMGFGDVKEKMISMIGELLFMGVLSFGVWLMCC